MVRLAANLSMMFREQPFLDRFEAAAQAGFSGIEYLFPYDHAAADIRRCLEAFGLQQVLFNLPAGDWEKGERGLAGIPGREADFRAALMTALDYAQALGCPRLHVMAGVIPEGADEAECVRVYERNLGLAARLAEKAGCEVLIEPINTRDMPGYLLNTQAMAQEVISRVGAGNLRLQFDIYHCQIMEGDLTRTLERVWPLLSHVQIAGVPDRHEPDGGEVSYRWLLNHLAALGYDGWVGCEYVPRGDTTAGLSWARDWGYLAQTPEEG
ncbi:2-oxo-tetronate isomerase [wastewater metagenome]|uniref:2-oxo-tetronate isomerase n=2 Tax=unclassified sequences TaxID=12908 RepID=A0A5B8RHB5_9ZZZZ|nr:2-oxo-tetronate isomerase [uncultured organism]